LCFVDEENMALSEEAISYLEKHIPELANVAFKQAYWAALASGSSVLVSKNGTLSRFFLMESRNLLSIYLP
jgi:hypothetical protein